MFIMMTIKGLWGRGEQENGKTRTHGLSQHPPAALATPKALLLTFVSPAPKCQNLDVLLSLGKNFHQLHHIYVGLEKRQKAREPTQETGPSLEAPPERLQGRWPSSRTMRAQEEAERVSGWTTEPSKTPAGPFIPHLRCHSSPSSNR